MGIHTFPGHKTSHIRGSTKSRNDCYSVSVCLCLGPAGTGKTESVKALGNQMGRFVLVFNCDETFDFQVDIIS